MNIDADSEATAFIEWVYSNPGKPPEEYACKLAEVFRATVFVVRYETLEESAKVADAYWSGGSTEIAARIRALKGET